MPQNINHTNIAPEILLFNTLQGILKYIREDIKDNQGEPEKTIIYGILADLGLLKHDYLREGLDLFSRNPITHPRGLDVRLFFDAKRASEPTFHISLAGDEPSSNSIGLDENEFVYEQEDVIDGQVVLQTSPVYGRSFETSLSVICTSSNHHEVLLMYYVIRSGLLAAFDTMELGGFQNVRMSGKELQIREDLVPNHIFSRGVMLRGLYEVRVRRVFNDKKLMDICSSNSTPYI